MQIMAHSLGAQNFGKLANIEAFPVGTRPLVPMKKSLCSPVPQFKMSIFCVPCSFSDHQIFLKNQTCFIKKIELSICLFQILIC